MRTSAAILIVILQHGCYPAIAHPTRVGSGFGVVTALGMHVAQDEPVTLGGPEGRLRLLPTFGIGAALSVRDTSTNAEGPGLRVSVGTGFAMPVWQAYLELPRERFGRLDAGVGMAVHGARPRLVMPYVQVGQELGPRRSWFSQQGVAFGTPSSGPGSFIWVPTVGTARGVAGAEASIFITGFIGGSERLHGEICRVCSAGVRAVTRNLLVAGFSWGQIVVSNLPAPRP